METRRLNDPARFLELAGTLLGVDEARHNLLFGLAATLRDDPSAYQAWDLWLVDDEGATVGAAIMTPPFNLVVARPTLNAAHDALAAAIFGAGTELPGVTGAVPEVDRFASAWKLVTGAGATVRMEQRIYALREVRPVEGVSGRARQGTDADLELLRSWIRAFGMEALAGASANDEESIERVVQGRLRRPDSGFLIWEDDEPVSLAGWGGPTPTGIRIGPVYTPPTRRRRGYASALVAELSARLLAAGRRLCFLYTDATNPTSNRVYTNVGYMRVCDSRELAFAR